MTRDAARDVAQGARLGRRERRGEPRPRLADELYVSAAFVGAGPTLKRWRARARGRVGRINKRTCHITIALALSDGEADSRRRSSARRPVTLTEEPEPIVVDDATGEVVEPARRRPRRRRPRRSRSARRARRPRRRPRPRRGCREAAERPRRSRSRSARAPRSRRPTTRRRRSRRLPPSRGPAPQEGRDDRDRRGERDLVGQKIHPGGLRVGVIHDWKSNWYTGTKEFPAYIIEDVKIRDHIYGKLGHAGLSDILIRKDKQRITIDIYTARPGIVIGKSGAEVDALRREIHAMTQKNVHININEIKRPELDAKLVAQSIAEQLQNRVSFRRAMKRSLASAIRSGAQGVKITCGGRLGGARDVALGDLLRGPRPAAHAARRHRLRLRRGEDDLRPHRRQGLDQQGRDHARGLRHAASAAQPAGWASRTRPAAAADAATASAPSREGGRRGAAIARASAPSGVAAPRPAPPAERPRRRAARRRSSPRPRRRRRPAEAPPPRPRRGPRTPESPGAGRGPRGAGGSREPQAPRGTAPAEDRGVSRSADAAQDEVPQAAARAPARRRRRASSRSTSATSGSRRSTPAG